MTCFRSFIVVGVYFSLFHSTSNADFFRKYGLRQYGHLDVSAIKKLEKRYSECVLKLNRLDRCAHNDQIPNNLDIPSHSGFWELPGNPSKSKSVILWPNNTIPTILDKSVKRKSFEQRLACAMFYFHAKTCIRFVKKRKHHKNYLMISNKGPFCSSDEVGMKVKQTNKRTKQTIILSGTIDGDCWRHGTIVHEFLHVFKRV